MFLFLFLFFLGGGLGGGGGGCWLFPKYIYTPKFPHICCKHVYHWPMKSNLALDGPTNCLRYETNNGNQTMHWWTNQLFTIWNPQLVLPKPNSILKLNVIGSTVYQSTLRYKRIWVILLLSMWLSLTNKGNTQQEAHGPQLAHLSEIASLQNMHLLCNIFSILSLQLMKGLSFKQFLVLKKKNVFFTHPSSNYYFILRLEAS